MITLTEAKKIAQLIGYADRGCHNCVSDLVEKANDFYPDFEFTITNEDRYDKGKYQSPDEEENFGDHWLVVDVVER